MSSSENNRLYKIKNLILNYGMMMGCYILFFIILGFISASFPELDFEQYQQTELFKVLEENPLKFAVMAVIIAPLLEEGMFRSIIKPSSNEVLIFICSWAVLLAASLFPQEGHWALRFFLLALSALVLFFLLKGLIPKNLLKKAKSFFHRYYLFFWLAGAAIFGLVHIFNYVEVFEINLLLFLLIFPRIIAGFFFGKVKVENRALFWPVLMHAMNNGIIIILLLPQIL